eukprot:TRINITY_DN16481_c0_g1_i1.p1 TRINITY_DN16481_c0_g1~~TRINITY_DN16481_c0_g1_i1.p1  ORF type:complete len:106 (+),score=20.11 TRINITY_DN16481_c0_g1_i1:153-470(+)
MDDGHQKMQATKEAEANIQELDMVGKEIEYLMDLIVMPLSEMPIGSSENKSIIVVSSQEKKNYPLKSLTLTFSLGMNNGWSKLKINRQIEGSSDGSSIWDNLYRT